ncbi:hypothetical protein OOZ19_10695 [Saccharopolyspora sp. NFXS83]|uniref:SCO4225 family membrane protein n=1 Tax=Saccharopolyspora sp. NFXS83 TaxID=2993560 RepID=UPI00224A9B4B|nr:hypothetical protein [Saccharopolyspora sp. NFXS83]MCX2730709.1 hypothetical protein [Saccharopolyspora sp. NFXS83]
MHGSQRSWAAAFHRYLFNPAGLGYLTVVSAVWLWTAGDALLVDRADASLAGIWGFLVTAPTSLVFVQLEGPLLWAGVAFAAVFQALLLGIAYCGTPSESRRGV